jgi:parvulin-like peptidyl-prolyl isomerase
VVATPYGYQIFQLLDKRPARQRSLEEAADDIRRRLREDRIEAAYRPWLAGLMGKAKISIDEKALMEVKLDG